MTRTVNDNRQIGARIAAEREARGWDQADLAAKLDCAPEHLRRIEKGHAISMLHLERAAGAFGLPVEALTVRAD